MEELRGGGREKKRRKGPGLAEGKGQYRTVFEGASLQHPSLPPTPQRWDGGTCPGATGPHSRPSLWPQLCY